MACVVGLAASEQDLGRSLQAYGDMEQQIAKYKALDEDQKKEGAKVIFVATRDALQQMKQLSADNESFRDEVMNGRNDYSGYYKTELLSKCKDAYNVVRTYAISFKQDFPK